MTSFQLARLKLTGWYVGFVMLLSIIFSFAVYRFLVLELEQSLRAQTVRIFGAYSIGGKIVTLEDIADIYNVAKDRIFYHLLFVNGGILLLSSATAYFLAGKALYPVELAVEEQKRFIADASHELKTPLTSMKTEIEVVLRDNKASTKELRELLSSNLEEVEKMKKLSNYLLALSRYENTRNSLSYQKVGTSEIVANSLKKVATYASEKQIKIINDSSHFVFRANSAGIEELLVILLDNAIKYSPSKSSILIRAFRSKRHVIFEIEDNGIGIKSSDLPHIFNRFYRADTSRSKQKIDGYGLGLPIAKSIVELHRGKIEVQTTPGKGSVFTVILPLHN